MDRVVEMWKELGCEEGRNYRGEIEDVESRDVRESGYDVRDGM